MCFYAGDFLGQNYILNYDSNFHSQAEKQITNYNKTHVTVFLPATVQTGDLMTLCTLEVAELRSNPTQMRYMGRENAIMQGQVTGCGLGPVLLELVSFNVQLQLFIYTLSRLLQLINGDNN